jgi:hypothetical protein
VLRPASALPLLVGEIMPLIDPGDAGKQAADMVEGFSTTGNCTPRRAIPLPWSAGDHGFAAAQSAPPFNFVTVASSVVWPGKAADHVGQSL